MNYLISKENYVKNLLVKAQSELYKENSLVALSQEVLETVYNGPRNRSGNSELMNLKELNVILNTL